MKIVKDHKPNFLSRGENRYNTGNHLFNQCIKLLQLSVIITFCVQID